MVGWWGVGAGLEEGRGVADWARGVGAGAWRTAGRGTGVCRRALAAEGAGAFSVWGRAWGGRGVVATSRGRGAARGVRWGWKEGWGAG